MSETKPCLHCKQPMYKQNFSASNWKRLKTHRECYGPYHNERRRQQTVRVKCTKCGAVKPTRFFVKADNARGYGSICKVCDCARKARQRIQPDTSYLNKYISISWRAA